MLGICVSNYVGEVTTVTIAKIVDQLMSGDCCYRGRMIMKQEKPRRPLCSIEDSDCTSKIWLPKNPKARRLVVSRGSHTSTTIEVAGLLFALGADFSHVISHHQQLLPGQPSHVRL